MKETHRRLSIVITGGHLTPAVATITRLQRLAPNARIYFIGRKNVFDTTDVMAHEKETVEKMGVSFIPLTTGRMMRAGTFFEIVSSLMKVPLGFMTAFWYLLRIRPDVVVSFGGYIAVPVVIASWIMDIPVITHEQTQRIGLGTQIIAAFSHVVCVSNKNHLQSFRFVRCVYTGLPLRDLIVHAATLKSRKTTKRLRPLVFITGGSTGAMSINHIVYKALSKLLRRVDVVHQVGRASFDDAMRIQNGLLDAQKKAYTVVEYMSEKEYVDVVGRADCIVGRSGANTVAEIAALGKSAIFIPLPWAAYDEQYKNAEVLKRAGSASIIRQNEFSPTTFLSAIFDHIEHIKVYEDHAKVYAAHIKLNAAELFSQEIIALVGST